MDGSKLATILLGTCCALIGACGRPGEKEKEICERYAEYDGPPVDAAWCRTWLSDWHTSDYKTSRDCLARAKSRLEMRLCEFEDEQGATAYPFARRECALAATTMEAFEACAETAPLETEKTYAPVGPQPVSVQPATMLGLVHREQGWYALLLEPNYYVLRYEDELSLVLVPITSEGFGAAVWRIALEGFRPSQLKFLIGDEFFAYLTTDNELRTVRLAEQALPEVTLKLDPKQRIVAHALLPGATGPRGVVVTQPQGPPRPVQGGRPDEKRGPVETWIPRFRIEPLGGVARTLVEYVEKEGSSANVEFAASAINYPGAHPALAWAGPYGENRERPLDVALFDDDGTETFRTEIEGFEPLWVASTSDGITTIFAHRKFHPARDMTVFRFSVEGEIEPRRRLNWRTPHHAVPIACRDRLALVRVGAPGLNEGNYGFSDYWDVSGREDLDLPERIWWGKRLSNVEVFAGCDGQQPTVAWISPRASGGHVDAKSPFDFSFMTLP